LKFIGPQKYKKNADKYNEINGYYSYHII